MLDTRGKMNKILIEKAKFMKNTFKVLSFCSLSKKREIIQQITTPPKNKKQRRNKGKKKRNVGREVESNMSYLSWLKTQLIG